jgi:hypothetical protein
MNIRYRIYYRKNNEQSWIENHVRFFCANVSFTFIVDEYLRFHDVLSVEYDLKRWRLAFRLFVFLSNVDLYRENERAHFLSISCRRHCILHFEIFSSSTSQTFRTFDTNRNRHYILICEFEQLTERSENHDRRNERNFFIVLFRVDARFFDVARISLNFESR